MRAVNLIPTDQRSGARQGVGRSGGVAYAVLGLMAGLAILVYLYGSARAEISSSHAKVASLNAQVQGVESAAAQLAPYTSFIALRDEREQAVATLANTRFDWAHAFHEFSRVLPRAVTLTALGGTIAPTAEAPTAPAAAPSTGAAAPSTGTAAPAATSTSTSAGGAAAPAGASTSSSTPTAVASATPAGSVPAFTLSGCAPTQAGVAATLERLRLIDGVSAVTLQSSVKGTSAGGASSTSGCPGDYPVFTVQVTFDALPAPTATSSGATSSSTTASPASATAPATASSAPAATAAPTTSTAGAK